VNLSHRIAGKEHVMLIQGGVVFDDDVQGVRPPTGRDVGRCRKLALPVPEGRGLAS
jgi:hypothetical protein